MHIQDENSGPGSVEGPQRMTHLVQDFRGLRLEDISGQNIHSNRSSVPELPRQRARNPFLAPPSYGFVAANPSHPAFPPARGNHGMRHGRHGPHHPHSLPRGPQNRPWPCNWPAPDHQRDQEREREYARARALSDRRRRRPSTPIGYPWNVAIAEAELESSPNDIATISKLWTQIMSYWFPERAGFTVVENWSLPDPENRWMFTPLQADLAVMWLGSESPIAIVQVNAPAREEQREYEMEVRLKASASKVFERVAMWSSHPRMLMISAAGSRWNAFIGSTDLTARGDLIGDGSDWFGPNWESKVTSEDSFKVMGFGVDAMKSYLSVPS